MSARIALQSDFHDYYDHHFCGSWQTPVATFNRWSRGGLARDRMLAYLEREVGLAVPRHGRVRDLVPDLTREWPPELRYRIREQLIDVVVYTDPMAHGGEGKCRLSAARAFEAYPDAYASEFVPAQPSCLGLSLRYLRVGRRQFWLRYASADDWRSNCGEVTVECLAEEQPADDEVVRRLPYPLVAIDFVPAGRRLYAVDLNVAPGLRGSGVEQRLPPSQVFAEIVEVMTLLGPVVTR